MSGLTEHEQEEWRFIAFKLGDRFETRTMALARNDPPPPPKELTGLRGVASRLNRSKEVWRVIATALLIGTVVGVIELVGAVEALIR